MPCGNTKMPAPKCFTSLPFASNLRMGSRLDPRQVLAEQRSATQTLLPSRSMATPAAEPQVLGSGIFAQFSTERYALGRLLVGPFCAEAGSADKAKTAAMADKRASFRILSSLIWSLFYTVQRPNTPPA